MKKYLPVGPIDIGLIGGTTFLFESWFCKMLTYIATAGKATNVIFHVNI